MSQVPPPPPPPSTPPTQVAGQQATPSTAVPAAPTGQVYAPAVATKTNTLAIISLVAGVGSFVAHIIPGVGGFTVALVAIVTGFMARNEIRKSGEQGMWMANAGIIIGFVHLGLIVIAVLAILFVIFVLGVALFGIAAHSTPSPVPS